MQCILLEYWRRHEKEIPWTFQYWSMQNILCNNSVFIGNASVRIGWGFKIYVYTGLRGPTPLNIFSVSKCQLPVNITEAIIHGIVHRILAKPTQHTHTKGYIDVLCWIQRLIIIQLTCRFLRKDKFPTAHRTDWCAEIKVLPNIYSNVADIIQKTQNFLDILSAV
jgi:hypothetical protein